ncbi:hypothetical protein SAY86_014539 [Trapa natans]|uniref:Uncharacterized protein n=1 Tax=Trapa natans TaxID=22666 RepID=A0AAN7KUE5_TRANT|nr:hypothetical protein SAY86_014539 [Trapa natans]
MNLVVESNLGTSLSVLMIILLLGLNAILSQKVAPSISCCRLHLLEAEFKRPTFIILVWQRIWTCCLVQCGFGIPVHLLEEGVEHLCLPSHIVGQETNKTHMLLPVQ